MLPAEADRLLAAAALTARRRMPAFARATGWLAEALRAEQSGDQRQLLAACRRGFGLLEEHLAWPGDAGHNDLAALRDVSVRLERAEPGGFPAAVLQRERLRLEAVIRGRALRARPAGTAVAMPFDVGALLDAPGPAGPGDAELTVASWSFIALGA